MTGCTAELAGDAGGGAVIGGAPAGGEEVKSLGGLVVDEDWLAIVGGVVEGEFDGVIIEVESADDGGVLVDTPRTSGDEEAVESGVDEGLPAAAGPVTGGADGGDGGRIKTMGTVEPLETKSF